MPGFTELTVVRELGQPSLQIDADREKIARYGINVSDVEAVIQAVGGQAATQVIQGEKLFDLGWSHEAAIPLSTHEIGDLLVRTPSGQQVPSRKLATIRQGSGASFIYRENNSRYIGVQFSIEGRDLARAVADGQAVKARHLAAGLHAGWGGEYSEYVAARISSRHRPVWRFADFHDPVRALWKLKFPVTVVLGVVMTEPVGPCWL